MRGKEPERDVAALRWEEGNVAPREKSRRDDAFMFGISIKCRNR